LLFYRVRQIGVDCFQVIPYCPSCWCESAYDIARPWSKWIGAQTPVSSILPRCRLWLANCYTSNLTSARPRQRVRHRICRRPDHSLPLSHGAPTSSSTAIRVVRWVAALPCFRSSARTTARLF
jgi:hypothetical protein